MLQDHPRIRGEKSGLRTATGAGEGSPPHTRGKDTDNTDALKIQGITPAYAGKSLHLFEPC